MNIQIGNVDMDAKPEQQQILQIRHAINLQGLNNICQWRLMVGFERGGAYSALSAECRTCAIGGSLRVDVPPSTLEKF